MFSSLRNAVENLAPQPIRHSLDGRPSEHEPTASPARAGRAHMSLEERLRAMTKPALGEVLPNTPTTPAAVQPQPLTTATIRQSPRFVPLPPSRPATPVSRELHTTHTDGLVATSSPTDSLRHPEADIHLPDEEDSLHSQPSSPSAVLDVDSLQQRLRLLEQRFTDVSSSYKRLRAEKVAADAVLADFTQKSEISQDEIHRLMGKLTRQDERVEELRDTHKLESASQSEQIERLRKQCREAEALVQSSITAASQSEAEASKRTADIARLEGDVQKYKGLAKEEEEKRVKAISLLKTVRQKLVKAEKEKEDAAKETNSLKTRLGGDQEKDKAERVKLQKEIDAVNAERESAVNGLKAQFDRELATAKERFEKDLTVIKGQYELEAVTTKSSHTKELTSKSARITALEKSVNSLSNDKNTFFEQLQLRQAELESSQSHIESMQSQNTELQYQLREANERLSLLTEDVADARRENGAASRNHTTSAEEVSRLLAAAESKHELKFHEVKKNLAAIEKERNDGDAEWSRKLREKAQEVEDVKSALNSAIKSQDENIGTVDLLREEIARLNLQLQLRQEQITGLSSQTEAVKISQSSAVSQIADLTEKIGILERSAAESQSREAQLRANNKTLREELRKVQSSAALLERQRNPGVGYWTSRADNTSGDPRSSMSSNRSSGGSRPTSPSPNAAPSSTQDEEQVNLEYLRNVILQFLEHKEMRPSLVKVLSIILQFTPAETRRLVAKV